jgi:hypothetical protein
MTGDDLMTRLRGMGSEEKEQFKFDLGHGRESDDVFVLAFVENLEFQSKVCYRLGVQCQADKVAEATLRAAEYAKRGFNISVWALGIAILSLIVSAGLSLLALR